MKKLPILIPARKDEFNPQLALTLRTIDRNFPHSEVWVAGFTPHWLSDSVKKFPVNQLGNGWENVIGILGEFVDSSDTPEQFWYFNDDFFVLKKITKMDQITTGTLAERSAWMNGQYLGEYPFGAKMSLELLQKNGFEDPMNFDTHLPMLMDKKNLAAAIDMFHTAEFKFWPHLRTIYGAIAGVKGVLGKDVKNSSMNEGIPIGAQFVSTSLESFLHGKVGRELQELFSIPGAYEKVYRPE